MLHYFVALYVCIDPFYSIIFNVLYENGFSIDVGNNDN